MYVKPRDLKHTYTYYCLRRNKQTYVVRLSVVLLMCSSFGVSLPDWRLSAKVPWLNFEDCHLRCWQELRMYKKIIDGSCFTN